MHAPRSRKRRNPRFASAETASLVDARPPTSDRRGAPTRIASPMSSLTEIPSSRCPRPASCTDVQSLRSFLTGSFRQRDEPTALVAPDVRRARSRSRRNGRRSGSREFAGRKHRDHCSSVAVAPFASDRCALGEDRRDRRRVTAPHGVLERLFDELVPQNQHLPPMQLR